MDSLELNKAFAAVLVAGIAFVGAGQVSQVLVKPKEFHGTALKIDVPEKAGTATAAIAPQQQPINVLLASADAGRGEALVKQQGCVACHSFNEGGKNGVGPNLYGVVGAPHASKEGFAYSAVLKSKKEPWNYEELSAWLLKPSAYAPGTKMSYAGLGDETKRADIIMYLRSLSHEPLPLPEAPAKAAAEAGKPVQAAAAGAPAPAAPGATPAAAAASSPAPAGGNVLPIAARLASADPAAGEASTKRLGCVACHSFNEGGKNGVGPNLYGVVNAKIGEHAPGYTYSNALKGKDAAWNYEELDKWLLKPSAYAPGTKMSYAGIGDAQVRANVIDYLRTLSASPAPLPN